MCTKTFLGMFPLRMGNMILAYGGIATSVVILIFISLMAHDASLEYSEAIRNGDYGLDLDPEEERLLNEEDKKALITLAYFYILTMVICYYFVYMMFIIFSVFLAIGTHHEKRGLLNAYFVYGFVHCCFSLFLAALHYYINEYVEATLLVVSDVLFLFCLFGVKGLMNTINCGQVYARYEGGIPHKA